MSKRSKTPALWVTRVSKRFPWPKTIFNGFHKVQPYLSLSLPGPCSASGDLPWGLAGSYNALYLTAKKNDSHFESDLPLWLPWDCGISELKNKETQSEQTWTVDHLNFSLSPPVLPWESSGRQKAQRRRVWTLSWTPRGVHALNPHPGLGHLPPWNPSLAMLRILPTQSSTSTY